MPNSAEPFIAAGAGQDDPYEYIMTLCDPIPEEDIPAGCKDQVTNPTVVKYNKENPDICTQV
jgi:hypothetical protein